VDSGLKSWANLIRLYDQAQLLSVYLDAFLVSGDAEMLGAVYDIVKYLTSPPLAAASGGFYSSEDADSYYAEGDSEKREGAFYVWTEKELQTILGERDADILGRFYNVGAHGNVSPEHDAHDELINQNVLAVSTTPDALAKDLGMTREEVIDVVKRGKAKLLEQRDASRPRPALDDKIVVAWNGLAIGALARTSAVLGNVDAAKSQLCRDAAVKAVTFITSTLFDEPSGTLKRIFRDGPGDAPAFADDYTFFIQGLLELYEATFDDQYLKLADSLQRKFTAGMCMACSRYSADRLVASRNANRPLLGSDARRLLLHPHRPARHAAPPQGRHGRRRALDQRRRGHQPVPARRAPRGRVLRLARRPHLRRLRPRGRAASLPLRQHGARARRGQARHAQRRRHRLWRRGGAGGR